MCTYTSPHFYRVCLLHSVLAPCISKCDLTGAGVCAEFIKLKYWGGACGTQETWLLRYMWREGRVRDTGRAICSQLLHGIDPSSHGPQKKPLVGTLALGLYPLQLFLHLVLWSLPNGTCSKLKRCVLLLYYKPGFACLAITIHA